MRRILRPAWEQAPQIADQILNSRGGRAFLTFLPLYFLAIIYCGYAFERDPTSAFFDPQYGYERRYSVHRQAQAEAYINASHAKPPRTAPSQPPKLCVGIATVARPGDKQYVRYLIGSLLDGLTEQERRELHLITFIAHTNPIAHPIFEKPWLDAVSDEVMLYNVTQETLGILQEFERSKNFRAKGARDYAYVLERCIGSNAPYVTVFDDDTLAVAGWYPRVMAAIREANAEMPKEQQNGWLYLRLFFTEEFLGWHSEFWHIYLVNSLALFSCTGLILLALRQCGLHGTISNRVVTVVCFVCVPACIILYFLAGRLSLHPLGPGVYKMPKYGCCGQALLYPRDKASVILDRFRQRGIGYPDALVEELANEKDFVRWAVMPSLVQHIGSKSSKGDDFGSGTKQDKSVAEKIWSFGFEDYSIDDMIPSIT